MRWRQLETYLWQGRMPLRLLERAGFYRPAPETFRKRRLTQCVLFSGDLPAVQKSPPIGRLTLPGVAPEEAPNFVCGEEFAVSRPVSDLRRDVLYSVDGVGFERGAADEMLSIRPIHGAWPLRHYPRKSAARRFPQATIIQGEIPRTYGDWVSEQVRCLALAGEILEPLLLPDFMARRGYVRYELGRLGIDFVSLDRPAHIETACVLFKPRPFVHWIGEDVDAWRKLFGIEPPAPRPGSILYLSRAGVTSRSAKVAVRTYRSAVCAEAVAEMGGRVVETEGLNVDDFAALAEDAETVVADHGAAMFNLMQWRTRNVVEIAADDWWSECFVFLGAACGVENHAVIRCDPRSDDELKAAIRGHVERFREGRAQLPRGVPTGGGNDRPLGRTNTGRR